MRCICGWGEAMQSNIIPPRNQRFRSPLKGGMQPRGNQHQPIHHPRPLKPVATTYFSAESEREAFGLACFTVSKFCFRRESSSPSAPPAKTLQTKAPPGANTSSAKSSAASAKAIIRRWSVDLCPVVGAAISERTMSVEPSSKSCNASGASSSRKSFSRISDPCHRRHAEIVDTHNLAFGAHRLDGDLQPAAGRAAKINDPCAGL